MSDRVCAHLQQLFHHDDPAQVRAGLELALALPAAELEPLCEGCGLVPAERGGGWLRLRAGRWLQHPVGEGPYRGEEEAERLLLTLVCRSETAWAAALRARIERLELGSGQAQARWMWSDLARLPRLRGLWVHGRFSEDEPFEAGPFERGATPPLLARLERLELDIDAGAGVQLRYRLPRLPRLQELGVAHASAVEGWARAPQLRVLELRGWRGAALPHDLPASVEELGLAGSALTDFTSLPALSGLRALHLHPRPAGPEPHGGALIPSVQLPEQLRLTSLAGLPVVRLAHPRLVLKARRLETLEGLSALQGLRALDLAGCHALQSLSGLAGCTELRWLRLSGAAFAQRGGVAGLDLTPLQPLVERGVLRGVLLRNTTLTPDRTPDWLRPVARWDLRALPGPDEDPPRPPPPAPPPGLAPEAADLWRLLVPLLDSESPVLQQRALDLLPRIDAHPALVDALVAGVRQVFAPGQAPPWWQPDALRETRWEGGALAVPGFPRARWREALVTRTGGGPEAEAARARVVEVARPASREELLRLPGLKRLSLREGQPPFGEDLSDLPVERLDVALTRAAYGRWRRLPVQPARALRLEIGALGATSRSQQKPALEPLPVLPGLQRLDLIAKTTTESVGRWTVQPDLEELHLTGLCRFPGLAQQPLLRLHLHEMWSLPQEALGDLPPGLRCLALPPPFAGLIRGWPGTPELVLIEMDDVGTLDLSRLHRVRDLTLHRLRGGHFAGMEALPAGLRSLTLLRCPEFQLAALGRAGGAASGGAASGCAPLSELHMSAVADLRPLARPLFRGLRSLSAALGGPLPKKFWEPETSAPAGWFELGGVVGLPQLERLHLAWDRAHLSEPDWDALRALPETTRITLSVPAESAGETWRADGAALCAALPAWLRARVAPGTPLCSQRGVLAFDD